MSTPYKHFRRMAEMTVDEAAAKLNISPRTLHRYESGEIKPPPETVYQMAVIYRAPTLLRWYRATEDPIGQKFETPILNGTNRALHARLFKLAEECQEAAEAAMEAARLTLNKESPFDFNDRELAKLSELYAQAVTDLKQAIDEVEEAYMEMFGVDYGVEAMLRHRQKMIERGYLVEKQKPATAKVAEKRVPYKTKIAASTAAR